MLGSAGCVLVGFIVCSSCVRAVRLLRLTVRLGTQPSDTKNPSRKDWGFIEQSCEQPQQVIGRMTWFDDQPSIFALFCADAFGHILAPLVYSSTINIKHTSQTSASALECIRYCFTGSLSIRTPKV